MEKLSSSFCCFCETSSWLDALLGLLEALLRGLGDLGDPEDVVAGVGLDRAGDLALARRRRPPRRSFGSCWPLETPSSLPPCSLEAGSTESSLATGGPALAALDACLASSALACALGQDRPRGRGARAARTAARSRCSSPRSRRRRRSALSSVTCWRILFESTSSRTRKRRSSSVWPEVFRKRW